MFAIISTGGKQYKVKAGDVIHVEKLDAAPGSVHVFDKVLALMPEDAQPVFGAPLVDGASISASVLSNGKNKKVVVYKYKPKKGYHKKIGHRQSYTSLRIDSVNAPS